MKKAGAEVEKLYKKARKIADSSDDTESSDPAETCGAFVDADQKIYLRDFHDAVKFGAENPNCVYLEDDTYIYYWESEEVAIKKLKEFIEKS